MTVYTLMVIPSSDDKRARILEAALRLFLRYGVRRTSVDDVAREAGIAKGTVYLYYASKESLYAAVAQKFCDDMLADAGRALAAKGTLTQRLVAFLDAWEGAPARLVASSPHVAELLESKAALPAGIFANLDNQMHEALGSALRDAGVTHRDAVQTLCAAAIGTLETGDIGEEPYRARLTTIVEILLAGLRTSVVSTTSRKSAPATRKGSVR